MSDMRDTGDMRNDRVEEDNAMDREDMPSDDMTHAEMTRDDLARDEMARGDMTRGDMTRGDMTREDMSRGDMTRDDMTRDDMTRDDMTRDDMAREGMAGQTVPATTREPVRSEHTGTAEIWPDMGDLRTKFDAIQSEFIDDPKRAVEKAEGLVKEIVDRLTRSMNERMDTMHRGVEQSNDTEQLRQTMRGYRDLVDWMETHRAA